MKKFITLLVVIALIITSIISIKNIHNSEWETVVINHSEVLSSKDATFVYEVILHNGELHTFTSSRQWADNEVIKVLVRETRTGVKAIRGKSLTKAEKDVIDNETAKAAYEEILSLVTAHLEFCATTNSINERYASSQSTLAAIDNIMLSYPDGFDEFAFYDVVEENELRLAMIGAQYLF